MNRLNNKVAIVTGAAGGIGKAIAQAFATEGAKVIATDKQEYILKEWVGDMQKEGFVIESIRHDITSESDWEIVLEKAMHSFGKIDILINNAGIYPAGATTANTDIQDWNNILHVNLTGAFIGSKLCAPYLKLSGSGAILNISSIAGVAGGNGPAYSASKAGLIILTKDQAMEFANDNIRVNAILPGGVLTPMTDFLMNDPAHESIEKNMCPLQRIGLPSEIAMGAVYLASDEASYTTGTTLTIDGGLTAR